MASLTDLHDKLGAYYLAINPGYKWVEFQQTKVIPALEKVERGEIKRLAIFMPPGHAKSDQSTRTFIPWYLGRNPSHSAMVCSYSADLASDDFGARIKARMSSPLHLQVFPKSAILRDSRSKTHFTNISGGNFYAVGFGGGITGKRLDCLVLDDLIKNKMDAESEAVQEELFGTYRSVFKDRLKPNGRIIMCMHRWLGRDIAGRILEWDGVVEDGGQWTVLKLAAEDPPDSENFLWEEYYGKPYYLDFKKDDDTWAAKFQQDPLSSKTYKFKHEWLNFFDHQMIVPGKFNAYMFVDPAASKSKKSDYTVINVFCAGQDKKFFLVDWVWDRLDPSERMKEILRLCRRWNPQRLYYETYGLNSDHVYIREKMQEDNYPASAYPIPIGRSGPGHNNTKHSRIDNLIPLYSSGRIYLPYKFERKRYDGVTVDYTQEFIDKEYSLYRGRNSIPHDDNLDCQSRLVDPDVQPHIEFVAPAEELGRQNNYSGKSYGSSWYSVY